MNSHKHNISINNDCRLSSEKEEFVQYVVFVEDATDALNFNNLVISAEDVTNPIVK
jgi:hypothetical protein